MTATIKRTGQTVRAIDVFCGAGGSSQGIHAAGADVRAAANHNQIAIDCHTANFPDTEHWRADLVDPESADYRDPGELPEAEYAWFSPACTFHSPANAAKVYARGLQMAMFEDDEWDEQAYVNSERSRVTMSCVLRYASNRRPEIMVIENVIEVCMWGPGRDGSTFKWWLSELVNLGYDYEACFLNSMFFPPCPQSRDRVYIVCWRKGNAKPDLDYRPAAYCTSDSCGGRMTRGVQTWKPRQKTWPLPKYGRYGSQYFYSCEECRARVDPVAWPAYSAIDWSNLGPSIAERNATGKTLAPATMDRIRRGLAKFRGGPPIVIPAKAVWGADRYVTDPFSVQTSQQDKALVSGLVPMRTNNLPKHAVDQFNPLTTSHGGGHSVVSEGVFLPAAGHTYERPGQTRAKPLHQPLFTQHATMSFGFAHMPFIAEMRGGGSIKAGQHPVTDPAHGVTAGGFHHGLTSLPFMLNGQDNESVGEVTNPAFTVRANGGAARLVTPALFAKFNGGPTDTAWHAVNDPLQTITAGGKAGIDPTGLVVLPWLEQWRSDPVAVTEQLATVMTHLRHSLASVEAVPMDRITEEDLQAVRFRMLDPDPELRRAMAFADDFILLAPTKSSMTSLLGNAVTPPTASWLTEQCLKTLGNGSTNKRTKAA